MFDKLVVVCKNDFANTIIEWKSLNRLILFLKLTGHSPNDVLVQPVEKLSYDKNSSSRFKIIKRHETELNTFSTGI